MKEEDITRKMLKSIRESIGKNNQIKPLVNEESFEKDNFLTKSKILMEEAENKMRKKKLNEDDQYNQGNVNENDYIIKSNDKQFSTLRSSMEDTLRKTIGDVDLKDDALIYHPSIDDITLDGTVKGINTKFQFRLSDPSGNGCYITCADLQLTDSNAKTIEKIRAAFENWKDSLTSDGTTMRDIQKAAERKKDE